MSDTTGAFPPPPPASVPPPVYGAPPAPAAQVKLPRGYKLPPGYQGPTAPDYMAPYQQQALSPCPQPINPGAVAFGSAGAILYQFGGPALGSVIAGAVTVGVPLMLNRYYIILPVVGLLSGLRAVTRGRLLGGLVGIGLNVLGGIFTLVGMFGV